MKPVFETGFGKLFQGDCLDLLGQLPDTGSMSILLRVRFGLHLRHACGCAIPSTCGCMSSRIGVRQRR